MIASLLPHYSEVVRFDLQGDGTRRDTTVNITLDII